MTTSAQKTAEIHQFLRRMGIPIPLTRVERMRRNWSRLKAHLNWFHVTTAPSQPGDRFDQMRVSVHIRRWHPGWWLFIAHAYWQVWQRAGKESPHGG